MDIVSIWLYDFGTYTWNIYLPHIWIASWMHDHWLEYFARFLQKDKTQVSVQSWFVTDVDSVNVVVVNCLLYIINGANWPMDWRHLATHCRDSNVALKTGQQIKLDSLSKYFMFLPNTAPIVCHSAEKELPIISKLWIAVLFKTDALCGHQTPEHTMARAR